MHYIDMRCAIKRKINDSDIKASGKTARSKSL